MDLINMYCICSLKCTEIYEGIINQHHPILTYKFKYIVDFLNEAISYGGCIPYIEVYK